MNDSSFLGIPSFIWWMVLFCFGILFATFFVRKIAEGLYPPLAQRPFWRTRFLPLFPLCFGAAVALAVKKYNYPEDIATPFTRALYGFVMGGISGWVFKIVKAKVKTTYGVDIDLSNPPPQGMDVNVQVHVPAQDKLPEEPKETP